MGTIWPGVLVVAPGGICAGVWTYAARKSHGDMSPTVVRKRVHCPPQGRSDHCAARSSGDDGRRGGGDRRQGRKTYVRPGRGSAWALTRRPCERRPSTCSTVPTLQRTGRRTGRFERPYAAWAGSCSFALRSWAGCAPSSGSAAGRRRAPATVRSAVRRVRAVALLARPAIRTSRARRCRTRCRSTCFLCGWEGTR